MWKLVILSYDEMINGIGDCPYSWDKVPTDRPLLMILLYSALLISIMAIWRLLLAKYVESTTMTYNYIFVETGIDIPKLNKPLLTLISSKQTNIDEIEVFCQKVTSRLDYNNSNSSISDTLTQQILPLSKKTGIDKNKLSLYLKDYISYHKKLYLVKKHINKYCEELWKSITMLFVTMFGIYALYDKAFLYDSSYLFGEFPQSMPFEIEMYYYLSISYHGHRLVWQYFDAVRKDWWAKLIHHYVTMCLLLGSYCVGFTEIGCYVLILHDNTDFFLSLAKILDYSQCKRIFIATSFVFFALSWFVGRIGIFMFGIILPCFQMYYICAQTYMYVYYAFFGGLTILWCLHCYWGYLIVLMIYKLIFKGTLKDNRSDDETEKRNRINHVNKHRHLQGEKKHQ